MKTSELFFCVLYGDNSYHEDPDYNIIIFCPIVYWDAHKCLPDYFFANQIDDLMPNDYVCYAGTEECCWASKKSIPEIEKELINLGFTKNNPLEDFLTDLWVE